MGQFDRQIATALRLIKKNGQSVQWLKQNVTPNVSEPWNSTSVETIAGNPYICFLPLDLQGKKFLMSLGVAPEVAVGTFYGLMGAVSFQPAKKDVVQRDGVRLQIETIDLLNPNGQNILWTMVFNK